MKLLERIPWWGWLIVMIGGVAALIILRGGGGKTPASPALPGTPLPGATGNGTPPTNDQTWLDFSQSWQKTMKDLLDANAADRASLTTIMHNEQTLIDDIEKWLKGGGDPVTVPPKGGGDPVTVPPSGGGGGDTGGGGRRGKGGGDVHVLPVPPIVPIGNPMPVPPTFHVPNPPDSMHEPGHWTDKGWLGDSGKLY